MLLELYFCVRDFFACVRSYTDPVSFKGRILIRLICTGSGKTISLHIRETIVDFEMKETTH
jgi:hypothetical protein